MFDDYAQFYTTMFPFFMIIPILYHIFPFFMRKSRSFLSSPDGQEVGIAINQFLLQDGQVNQFLHLGPGGHPESWKSLLFREIYGNNYEVI